MLDGNSYKKISKIVPKHFQKGYILSKDYYRFIALFYTYMQPSTFLTLLYIYP